MVAAVVVVVILIVSSIVFLLPYLMSAFNTGPAPVWRSFAVFDQNGELATESCRADNLQGGFGGLFSRISPESVITCSYNGQDYKGKVGTDCNIAPNGPAPRVNGTLVPFDGCTMTFAPLQQLFSDIFVVTGNGSSTSLPVYSSHAVLAWINKTSGWKANHCALLVNNETKNDGQLVCYYLGVPYSGAPPASACTFKAQVQVNGVAVPPGGCILQRSEART